MSKNYLGIDLGTTNSVASTVREFNGIIKTQLVKVKRISGIRNEDKFIFEKGNILPSYFMDRETENGGLAIVGDFAKETYKTQPYLAVKSVKSHMGSKCLLNNKKPEEISGAILKCIKDSIEKEGKKETDVVIAVPASFNIAQRQATLKSAEIAGFDVKNENGEYKENILISEPEAVLYNVINEVQKGTVRLDLDFTKNKKILVFDIGGGTLDVTLHNVVRDEEIPDIFNVEPIAISRYSNIAGDVFDETVGEKLFEKYLNDCKKEDENNYENILANKSLYLSQMITYAEELKIDIHSEYETCSYDEIDFNKDMLMDYGGSMYNGYDSGNRIKICDYEEILRSLLGEGLVFNDYKKLDSIENTKNIIYPILDVLNEASKKLGDVTVDGVILNGGMSKLYFIEDRISEFFGLKAIKVNDPDESVAQGASVYHYYLKNSGLENRKAFDMEDMISNDNNIPSKSNNIFNFVDTTEEEKIAKIKTISNILNDDIYLGLKNGYVTKIAERGANLPYNSSEVHKFQLLAGEKFIELSLKVSSGKDYKTIATATLHLANKTIVGNNVEVLVEISKSQIITVGLYQNEKLIDTMVVELGEEADAEKKDKRGKKMLAPGNIKVDAKQEINTLIQKATSSKNVKTNNEQIKQTISNLRQCLNPEDFVDEIVARLEITSNDNEKWVLLRLAKELIEKWDNRQKRQFERACLYVVSSVVTGKNLSGTAQQGIVVAITLLRYSQSKEALNMLDELIKKDKFRNPLLHTLGHLGYKQDYIYECFCEDIRKGEKISDSLKALGTSIATKEKSDIKLKHAYKKCKAILKRTTSNQEFNIAVETLCIIGSKINSTDDVLKTVELAENYNNKYEPTLIVSDSTRDKLYELMYSDVV